MKRQEPNSSRDRKGQGVVFMNDNKDAFDLWWEWAEKPLDSPLTIDAEIHDAVMALPPDERCDRAKVNEAGRRVGSAFASGVFSALWPKPSYQWSVSRRGTCRRC